MPRKNQKIWWLSERRWRRPRIASMVAKIVVGFECGEEFDSWKVVDKLESKHIPHVSSISMIIKHLEDLGYCDLIQLMPASIWIRSEKETPIRDEETQRSFI